MLEAAWVSVVHCQRVMKYERWNCSLGHSRIMMVKKGQAALPPVMLLQIDIFMWNFFSYGRITMRLEPLLLDTLDLNIII